MPLSRSRTFWQLFGTYGLLALASIAVLGFLVDRRVEQRERDAIVEELRIRAILVEEAFRGVPDANLQARVIAMGQRSATRITLIGSTGAVLADSEEDPALMENHADRPEIKDAQVRG